MTVGVVGLGLIGGSMAKSYQRKGAHRALGADPAPSIVASAHLAGLFAGSL